MKPPFLQPQVKGLQARPIATETNWNERWCRLLNDRYAAPLAVRDLRRLPEPQAVDGSLGDRLRGDGRSSGRNAAILT